MLVAKRFMPTKHVWVCEPFQTIDDELIVTRNDHGVSMRLNLEFWKTECGIKRMKTRAFENMNDKLEPF